MRIFRYGEGEKPKHGRHYAVYNSDRGELMTVARLVLMEDGSESLILLGCQHSGLSWSQHTGYALIDTEMPDDFVIPGNLREIEEELE